MKKLLKGLIPALLCAIVAAAPAAAYENVTPSQALDLVASNGNVYILDVRTLAEWQWLGHPGKNALGEGSELAGKVVNISYKIDSKGSMIVNPSFVSDVRELFGGSDAVLITMCRSGQRSVAAAEALEAEGFAVKNMVTGFEGGKDSYGYRTVNGWKMDGLPYTYSGAGYQD